MLLQVRPRSPGDQRLLNWCEGDEEEVLETAEAAQHIERQVCAKLEDNLQPREASQLVEVRQMD